MTDRTDWATVTRFYNGVISEVTEGTLADEETRLELAIYSPALGDTLTVIVPTGSVEDFMKHLALWNAKVLSNRRLS